MQLRLVKSAIGLAVATASLAIPLAFAEQAAFLKAPTRVTTTGDSSTPSAATTANTRPTPTLSVLRSLLSR